MSHIRYRKQSLMLAALFFLLTVPPGLPSAAAKPTQAAWENRSAVPRVETVKLPIGNIYTQPTSASLVLDTLRQGDPLTILLKEKEWYVVKLPDNRVGWAHENLFVAPEKLRQQAEMIPSPPEAPQPAQAPEKTPASVPAEKTPASVPSEKSPQIKPLETSGQKAASEPAPAEPDESPAQKQVVMKVNDGRVRAAPSLSAPIKFVLDKGDRASLFDRKGEWYYIKLDDGREGWSHQSLYAMQAVPEEFTLPEPAVAKSAGDKAVEMNVNGGRVRQGPSLDHAIQFKLMKGDRATVMEQQGNWYHIRLPDGREGWSHQGLFSRVIPDRTIQAIRVDKADGGEKVSFRLNGFFPPHTFVLEEDSIPKVVCDFFNTELADDIEKTIDIHGEFVQQIRIGVHKQGRPKIRVVMDLAPDQKYGVDQVFFKKENLYTLTFKPAL